MNDSLSSFSESKNLVIIVIQTVENGYTFNISALILNPILDKSVKVETNLLI